MKETIEIIENNKTRSWDARFSEKKVVRMFDGGVVPTPFFLATPREHVVVKIQALNPDCKVF